MDTTSNGHSKEFLLAFGKRLKSLRKEKKWSMEEAAAAINVSRSTYNHWEIGNRFPLSRSLFDIAQVFDTHKGYLLLESDEKTPPSDDLESYLKSVKHIKYKDNELTKEQIDLLTNLLESWSTQH